MARPTVADDAATVEAALGVVGPSTLRDINYNLKWTRSRAYLAILYGVSAGALRWARNPLGPYRGLAAEVSVAPAGFRASDEGEEAA